MRIILSRKGFDSANTRTAMIPYNLLHTEFALKMVRLADGSIASSAFTDHDVHDVLNRSGYHVRHFAQEISFLNPNYSSLIIPSRWFTAGRENLLGEFRREMLTNRHLAKLIVYSDATDIFTNVEIKGGLCYYLIDSNYDGACKYTLIEDGTRTETERNLNDFDILIREPRKGEIVKRIVAMNKKGDSVFSIISNDTPFGIGSNPKTSKKNPFDVVETKDDAHTTVLYHIENGKRKQEYIKRSIITKNVMFIDSIKVFIPGAAGSGNDPIVLGRPEIAPANSVCSQSFLFAAFDSELEAKNFVSYMKTKFFRFLVSAMKISQAAPNKVYRFVPIQDFSRPWSDNELYSKYCLSKDDIEYIEATIKPMDDNTPDE